MFQDFAQFWQVAADYIRPKPFIVMWNGGLSIYAMISQMQRDTWCANKFPNVEIMIGNNIIYSSTTRPSVGEISSLQGLDLYMLARLIITKKDIAHPVIKQIYVVPKEDSFF